MVRARRHVHIEDQRSFLRLMTCERMLEINFAMTYPLTRVETLRANRNAVAEAEQLSEFRFLRTNQDVAGGCCQKCRSRYRVRQ